MTNQVNNSNNQGGTISLGTVKQTYEILSEPMRIKIPTTAKTNDYRNLLLANGVHGASYKKSIFMNVKAIDVRKVPTLIQRFYELNDCVGVVLSAEEEDALTMPISKFRFNIVKEIIVHNATATRKATVVPTLPMRGDLVDCVIQYALNKNEPDGYAKDGNGSRILEIGDFIAPEAKTTSGTNWSSFAKTAGIQTSAPVAQAVPVASDEVFE